MKRNGGFFRLRNAIHQTCSRLTSLWNRRSAGVRTEPADSRGTHGWKFPSDRFDLNTKVVEEDLVYVVEFVSFSYHN